MRRTFRSASKIVKMTMSTATDGRGIDSESSASTSSLSDELSKDPGGFDGGWGTFTITKFATTTGFEGWQEPTNDRTEVIHAVDRVRRPSTQT